MQIMQQFNMLQSLLCIFLYLIICCNLSLQLGCKDEENQDVDWFIIYKLPKIEKEQRGSDLYDGKAYTFLTSKSSSSWKLSTKSIESSASMLGRTWQDLKSNDKGSAVSYLFYNDDPPSPYDSSANGHLKGVVAFDKKSGFWLSHSIPRFGTIKEYEYPKTALINGQTAICVTFGTSALNDICNHLLYCNPNIYEKKSAQAVHASLDQNAKSIFTEKPNFVRKAPFERNSTLKSLNKGQFYTFAKDNQLQKDIYSSIIAPKLRTSLVVESWRRGRGMNLDASCKSDYSVVDVASVDMRVSNREGVINFKSTEDHSKWAISTDPSWVCIGDLNRMASQAKRGGGALCFTSKSVWKAFKSIISDVSQCSLKG